MSAGIPPREIRRRINEVLQTDEAFVAFAEKHFPGTAGQFSNSMDRVAKVSLLMEREDPEEIAQALRS